MISNKLLLGIRLFNTSSVLSSNAKIMKKIMGGNKKRRRFTEIPTLPSATSFAKGAYEGKRSVNTKRVAVLNKLFMRYITDLMSTGESSSVLAGYNVEIQRVQVTPDFNCINVYWIAKGDENDTAIEKLLQTSSGLLRHELSQLKVIGVVPIIKFLKDKHLSQMMEIDLRLARADFGDDYVPIEPTAKLKSQLQLYTKLNPLISKQIQELNEEVEEEELYEVPEMPQNVFGLDHAAIMNKISKNICKNHNIANDHRDVGIDHEINQNPIDNNCNNQELKDFLFKRQLLKKKSTRLNENYRPELDALIDEHERKLEQRQKHLFDEYQDDDYIDDDNNVK